MPKQQKPLPAKIRLHVLSEVCGNAEHFVRDLRMGNAFLCRSLSGPQKERNNHNKVHAKKQWFPMLQGMQIHEEGKGVFVLDISLVLHVLHVYTLHVLRHAYEKDLV